MIVEAERSYWLVKSEPDAFGWDQQVANGVEPWTGVRAHMARNNLQAMKIGDLAFFYHSNVGKEIVGVVEVVRDAYPDPTAQAGGWVCVDMRAVAPMKRAVTLSAIKADPALEGFDLIRMSRLSVVPVSAPHWAHICALGEFEAPAAAAAAAAEGAPEQAPGEAPETGAEKGAKVQKRSSRSRKARRSS